MDDALSDNPDCPGCRARDEKIGELRELVERQSAQLERQSRQLEEATDRIEQLEGKVAKLEARLDKDSTNSSKPPSSDGPGQRAERDAPQRSERAQGAQPGHEGRWREDLPAEEVDQIEDVKPEECRGCGHTLSGTDPDPECHQVTDVVVQRRVREWRRHTLECPCCGKWTQGEMPDDVPDQQFGPTIAAVVTYLTGALHLSKREARGAVEELFDVEMSLGTVSNLEGRASEGLRAAYQQARGWLTESGRVHIDETTWWERHDNHWLWTISDGDVVAYRIDPSRGGEVARDLLDGQPCGQVVTDRHTAYNWIDPARRFLCWAHLFRNFKGWALEDGVVGAVGELLVVDTRQLFRWLERIRDGTADLEEARAAFAKLRTRMAVLLRTGARLADKPDRFEELLELEEAMWAFVDAEGWPTTNNEAERSVRGGVLWRKKSFGTQSKRGSRFVERIMTVVETLNKQGRRAKDFLEATWRHIIRGERRPKLLPT